MSPEWQSKAELSNEILRLSEDLAGVKRSNRYLHRENARLRTEVERLEENQGSLLDDYVMIPASEWQHMVDTEHKAEQLGARVARLEKAYDRIHPLGVSHAITHNRSRVVDLAEKIRNESPAQSLAAIEARALERFAETIEGPQKMVSLHSVIAKAKHEADRLRAEANDKEPTP